MHAEFSIFQRVWRSNHAVNNLLFVFNLQNESSPRSRLYNDVSWLRKTIPNRLHKECKQSPLRQRKKEPLSEENGTSL